MFPSNNIVNNNIIEYNNNKNNISSPFVESTEWMQNYQELRVYYI